MHKNLERKLKRDVFFSRALAFAASTFFLATAVIAFAYYDRDYQFSSKGFVWNNLLSAVALFFYCCFRSSALRKKKFLSPVLFCVWMLFLPNTFYMLTDLKYISQFDIVAFSEPVFPDFFWRSWAFTFSLVYSVFSGVAFGIVSLIDFEHVFLSRFSRVVRELTVAAVMLVSGFGVYIGRFARLNSWDIIRPEFLLEELLPYLPKDSIVFILLFAYISWILFVLLRGVCRLCVIHPAEHENK